MLEFVAVSELPNDNFEASLGPTSAIRHTININFVDNINAPCIVWRKTQLKIPDHLVCIISMFCYVDICFLMGAAKGNIEMKSNTVFIGICLVNYRPTTWQM